MKSLLSKLKIYKVLQYFFAYFLFFSFSLLAVSANALNAPSLSGYQQDNGQPPSYDYFQDKFLRYGDFVYSDNIKTVLFHKKGFDMAPPLIKNNSGETLILRFDDMDADYKDYHYTIIHCNADWQPSNLNNYDYIDGFYDDQIRNYRFSVNTIIDYTHYKLEFPNNNMRPRVSGNYILKVYLNGDPDQVVLTRKFKVYEQLVSLEGHVSKATRVAKRDEMQEINFVINAGNYRISNPYRDVRVSIKQNGRTDNIVWDLKPSLVMGNKLIYEYEDKNLFDGGNEFRDFDTRSLRYRSERVKEIVSTHDGYEVILIRDQRRSARRYTFREDLNGKFIVENREGFDPHVDADYAYVHFSLDYRIPEAHGNFYITGELTDWNYTSENRMKYSFRDNEYHLSLLLKQGFYNYMYVFLEDGKSKGETFRAEGNHSDTENDYTVYVYHRKPGDIYDSLIGILHLNSAI